MSTVIKQAFIFLGLYKAARFLYRALDPSQRRQFKEQQTFLAQFIRPGSLAFDVGANIGLRSEVMLSLGARVVAFEPQPVCAREVRARGNRALTVVQKAVAGQAGYADLHLKQASVQASLLENWQGGPSIGVLRVPVTTLDEEIARFGLPDFCKIDVEGFESQVVQGLSSPIPVVSFEYHCDERGIAKVRDVLLRLGELDNYEVNLIGGEEAAWLNSEWLDVDQFLRRFPTIAKAHFWGDIFARVKR